LYAAKTAGTNDHRVGKGRHRSSSCEHATRTTAAASSTATTAACDNHVVNRAAKSA